MLTHAAQYHVDHIFDERRIHRLPVREQAPENRRGHHVVQKAWVRTWRQLVPVYGAAHELLSPAPPATFAEDATLARAVERAGGQGNAALFVRVESEGTVPSSVVLTLGSDRKVAWAEVGASKAALGTLVRASLGR